MIPRFIPALCLAAPLFAQPATAQTAAAPRTQPTRDVVVTFRVDGQAATLIPGGIPGPLRLSWDAAGLRVRAEAEGRTQVALLDLRNHTGQVIDTTLRVVLPLRVRTADLQPLTLEGARLTPRGHETIAGLPCTTYAVDTGRAPGSVCLTADGVPLRGEGDISGKPGSFLATGVQYGRLPPDLFEVPSGYMAFGGNSSGGNNSGGIAGKLNGLGINPNDLRGLLGRPGK